MPSTEKSDARTQRFCSHLFASATPEFRLVAACCRWPLEAGPQQRHTLAAHKDLHWDHVFALASRHRVVGLVAAALAPVATVPEAIQQTLKRRAVKIQQQNMAHLGIALRIGRALETANIPFLVLKGAPLSQLAFGSTGVRHMRDLDLLVDPAFLDRTEDVLESLGLQSKSEERSLTPDQARLWRRFRKHHEFLHEATGVQVELHWRAFDNPLLHPPLSNTIQEIEVAPGHRLPTLSTEELFLALCVHGAGHAWFRMKWIADIAALLHTLTPVQWDSILRLAHERDLDRTIEQATLLCAALFGADSVPALPSSTRVGRWLATIASRALLTEETANKSPDAAFVPPGQTASRFLLRRSWRYRLEEVRIATASPVDWRTLPLPAALQFAYPLLRGPLWMRRRWLARSSR